jgi:biotin carboxyl carrier protein
MKLKAQLGGNEHSLSIRIEGQKIIAEVDGRVHQAEIRERNGDRYVLMEGSRVFDCRVESKQTFIVHLRQQEYSIGIIDPKRLSRTQTGRGHDHGLVEIVAPMPGKVVRVLVSEGADVTSGSGVLVVEAMKMQNELKTPKTGKVIAMKAQPGATVNAGEVLAVIE